jgi:16S rRNA (guanine(527)-N(7))-methyltransferase RsmG
MENTAEFELITNNLGLSANSEAILKIKKYAALLKKWNSRINLIASSESKLIQTLLLEGLWASTMYPESAALHLDLGSGGGFPAIPLRIMNPCIRLEMVDSRLKRVLFLETVVHDLQLENASAHHARIDQFLETHGTIWDCVSWKALKLQNSEISGLLERSHAHTQFWIFHGNQIPVQNPEWMMRRLRLLRREKFPWKEEWMLSIFVPA